MRLVGPAAATDRQEAPMASRWRGVIYEFVSSAASETTQGTSGQKPERDHLEPDSDIPAGEREARKDERTEEEKMSKDEGRDE